MEGTLDSLYTKFEGGVQTLSMLEKEDSEGWMMEKEFPLLSLAGDNEESGNENEEDIHVEEKEEKQEIEPKDHENTEESDCIN